MKPTSGNLYRGRPKFSAGTRVWLSELVTREAPGLEDRRGRVIEVRRSHELVIQSQSWIESTDYETRYMTAEVDNLPAYPIGYPFYTVIWDGHEDNPQPDTPEWMLTQRTLLGAPRSLLGSRATQGLGSILDRVLGSAKPQKKPKRAPRSPKSPKPPKQQRQGRLPLLQRNRK